MRLRVLVLDPSQQDDVKQALLLLMILSLNEILMLSTVRCRTVERSCLSLAIGVVDADEEVASENTGRGLQDGLESLGSLTLPEALMSYDGGFAQESHLVGIPYMQRRTRCKQRSISIFSVSFAIPSPCVEATERKCESVPTHDIIDNRNEKLVDHINSILASSIRARFAVGYFFLSGLTSIAHSLAHVKELRLLIGNVSGYQTVEQLAEAYRSLDMVMNQIYRTIRNG